MKKIFFFIFVVFLVLFFDACDSQKSTKVITVIGTSDLQGVLESSVRDYTINGKKQELKGGGIAKIATVFKKAQKENPLGVIIASNGDDLMGRFFHTFKGEAIYSLFSQAGYAYYAPGNHEFDRGVEVFADALGFARFKTICSDLKVAGTKLEGKCSSYEIVEKNGVKIGMFSLMTEDFALITSPGDVKLVDSNVQTAKKMVKTLRSKGCEIIVALTHIGFERDKELAKNVRDIDVIFGGHSHIPTAKIEKVGDTLVFNGGEQGSYVARLDLPLNKNNIPDKNNAKYTLIPLIASVKDDPMLKNKLEMYASQLPASTVLGRTTLEWDLRTDTLRRGESNVADMINDLLRDKFHVEIVMNNAGAFRGKSVYPPGDITDTRLHEIDEFSNDVYIFDIKGKYIKEILEHSAASFGRGGLMQVSGIRYTINLQKQPQTIEKNKNGEWNITQKGERVSDIEVIGTDGSLKPLEQEKSYKLLCNAYIVNHNGDGYFWFKKYGTNQKNTYTTFYSVMVEYLSKHAVLDLKQCDGRLKVCK